MANQTQTPTEIIKELQQYLRSIAYVNRNIPKIIPTGVYDAQTISAVKAFQREYGLNVTGEVDETTWNKIIDIFNKIANVKPEPIFSFPDKNHVLKPGDKGPTVYLLQVMLDFLSNRYINVLPVDITGVYDEKTTNAIKRLQEVNKFDVTGEADVGIWNAITILYNIVNAIYS